MRLGMVIDLRRCIGRDACVLACRAEHCSPSGVFFTFVLKRVFGEYPNARGFFLLVLCNQCEDPACLKACPSGAIYRSREGVVLVDEGRCVGAKACVSACPYGRIFYVDGYGESYYPGFLTPFVEYHCGRRRPSRALKCNLCYHRLREGREPACVETCPTEARVFGDLDDPDSRLSRYIRDRRLRAEPVALRPETGTKPKVLYLL